MQSILEALLPDALLVAGREGLRRRVSWSVVARATGLGEIEGGELVLVPGGRAETILRSAHALESAGVAGIVFLGADIHESVTPAGGGVPIAVASPGIDIRSLHEEIERFIARRRRDLFLLEQRLHGALVEAAIGGADTDDLLAAAASLSGLTAVLDRDGDVQYRPATEEVPPEELLVRVRIAIHSSSRPSVLVEGPPLVVAAPVVAGNERRGIVMLLDADAGSLDEAEAVLRSLASACAIALARVPAEPERSLEEVLKVWGGLRVPGRNRVIAVALSDPSSDVHELARASAAELSMRGIEHGIAVDGATVIGLVAASADVPWSAIARSIGMRLGTNVLRVGLGREYTIPAEARRSVSEACDSLSHAEAGGLTRFAEIELVTLLRREPAWQEFARARLAPLLDGPAGADLLRTLRAYLNAGLNAKEAARILHVHRNTLLYRLRRLHETLGVDLEDADRLFELDLAMRALDAAISPGTERGVDQINR